VGQSFDRHLDEQLVFRPSGFSTPVDQQLDPFC